MVLSIEGEMLDGFHVETVPEFNTDDEYSRYALGWLAGMRAIWRLYCNRRWQQLEYLGIDRKSVEPLLATFDYGPRLTRRQAETLALRVPSTETASMMLRMRYALLYRPTSKD